MTMVTETRWLPTPLEGAVPEGLAPAATWVRAAIRALGRARASWRSIGGGSSEGAS